MFACLKCSDGTNDRLCYSFDDICLFNYIRCEIDLIVNICCRLLFLQTLLERSQFPNVLNRKQRLSVRFVIVVVDVNLVMCPFSVNCFKFIKRIQKESLNQDRKIFIIIIHDYLIHFLVIKVE